MFISPNPQTSYRRDVIGAADASTSMRGPFLSGQKQA